ncbi:MAG: DUF4407 domain-containing protein [Bacteroidales bacterium]|nr:DUF4407 domain-containing protein [Bacteroidales bacterium]MBN2750363.1 DUF4407 domain-containing protein [Bacteroidales bacterium]
MPDFENNINRSKPSKLSRIYRFFCWCSGARLYLIERCPTEFNKYYGIGVIVLLTGVMASLSGGYAMFTVFNSLYLAAAFGALWGFLIFSLDWYIVSSIRKQHNPQKEFFAALPRLVLAILISVVISKPLEIKLFEKEIERQLLFVQEAKTAQYGLALDNNYAEIAKLENQNKELQDNLTKKEAYRNQLFSMVIAEAEGRSPTNRLGKGPVYREKKAELDRLDEELHRLSASTANQHNLNNQRIALLKQERDQQAKSANVVNRNADGFLARLDALGQLASDNPRVAFANWFIIILFIVIECSPVIVKLMSARGPYDELLESEEQEMSISIQKQLSSVERINDQQARFAYMLAQEKSKAFQEVELEYIMSQASAMREVNRLKVEKWLTNEKEKLELTVESNLQADQSFGVPTEEPALANSPTDNIADELPPNNKNSFDDLTSEGNATILAKNASDSVETSFKPDDLDSLIDTTLSKERGAV